MNRIKLALLLVCLAAPLCLTSAKAALVAKVPISVETATAMAASAFPLTIDMERGKLFLTDPRVSFNDAHTISLRVHVHAFDHRPAAGIALSEKGHAVVTAQPDYDPQGQKILLKNLQLDKLAFDRDVPSSRDFSALVRKTWATQVTNPVSADVPSHAYIDPFRSSIYDMSYDGNNIYLEVRY